MTYRITLLSSRSARIEFSKTDTFCDGPSFFFMNRGRSAFSKPAEEQNGKSIYRTDSLEIQVDDNASQVDEDSLTVHWDYNGKSGFWRPGDMDKQNLGASFSALDNCNRYITASGVHDFDPMEGQDGQRCSTNDLRRAVERALKKKNGEYPEENLPNEEIKNLALGKASENFARFPDFVLETLNKVRKFPPGFLSRSGLTIIRDTGPLWDENRRWFIPRPEGHFDLTVIACGDDFKGTLKEIANLAGPIPLLPKWALGIWFSCYRCMGPEEFRQLKKDFEKHDLPLEVVVIDNDWHEHHWHGFDWNRDLFPEPEEFFEWLQRNNLHNTFNVHPGYIPAEDSRLEEFRKRSGNRESPLSKDNSPHPIHVNCVPVNLMDKKQAEAWFEVFHRPLMEMGCDMWWIDGAMEHWDGEEGTAWLNHLYYEHTRKVSGKDVPAFSRASGMGCHRSTLAFSGDAWVQWEVLGQEVESTIRGANVLMAWWSHDIGGFWNPEAGENKPPDDLFVRWTQFGCLSPIMRYHSDHGVREPWKFDKRILELCREALKLRKRLEPYFYELIQEAHNTGVAPWRPMCFEFPEEEESYNRWRQAMIGGNMLYVPVIEPDGTVEAWFPSGEWKHYQTGEKIRGPQIKKWRSPLHEIPLFLI